MYFMAYTCSDEDQFWCSLCPENVLGKGWRSPSSMDVPEQLSLNLHNLPSYDMPRLKVFSLSGNPKVEPTFPSILP